MRTRMIFFLGTVLLLAVPAVLAQNTVDVLGSGPQPANTTGCVGSSTNCILANFDGSSNSHGGDIMTAITPTGVNFYFAGGAQTPVVSPAAAGTICVADSRMFTGLFAAEVANCQAGGTALNPVRAVLIIRDTGVLTESTIPVFQISTKDGDFLKNTVGYNTLDISNRPIRINVAVPNPLVGGPTGQHNCPNGQAVPAFVGPGTTNYTRNESLCLPAGAGQAVEPSLIVDSQGTIYVESIRGVPGGLDLWRWYRPKDGGPNTTTGVEGTLPFKYEGQPDGCGIFPANMFCTMAGVEPGGGDGDVAVNTPDPSTQIPNLAVVSLSAAEVTASHSTDRADMFAMPENLTAAHVAFDDRMWINAVDDPNHVYMEYHDFGTTSQIIVQRSSDGGQNYNDGMWTAVTDPTIALSVGPNGGGNIAGQIKVDHSSTASRGNVYQIFVGPANPTDNAQNSSAYFNTAYVGVASAANLTSSPSSYATAFKDYTIFSCGAGTKCPSGLGLGNLFPALAVDDFGYVYAAVSDGTDIYYAYSRTQGRSWSPAIQVTRKTTPATQAGMSNVFPWIAAEANGHVAIAWYGANKSGNSNTINASWNVFVAETVNGHAMTPAFTLSQATDHVNHMGSISTGGLTGMSDRSLADFFQIAMDPSHRVNIAYADNHAGTSVTYFTRQKQATSGIVTGNPCEGRTHETDAEGDMPGRNGGKASVKIHHDDCGEEPDREDVSDTGSGTDFHSTRVDSVTFNDLAHSVTITGLGTNDGSPVAFTIVAVDSSLVSPGLFSITLSDGYSNTGNLIDGSITVY